MLDSFMLPHYFIVFHPGTAGNFVTSTVQNLVNDSLATVEINTTGSAHTTALKKTTDTDYLTCGTFFYENNKFANFEEKVKFHKNRIEQLSITESQINWTHDFTNIPLYKILFPNAKILVITQNSVREKLVSAILQVHKNFLDKTVISPLNSEMQRAQEQRWSKWSFLILTSVLGADSDELANEIITDRHNPKYRDLIEYITIYGKLRYYNLLQYINEGPYEKDLANTVLLPVYNDPNKKYIIGEDYSYYTTECNKIPYECIIKNDSTVFLNAIESFVGKLNIDQEQFVRTTFCNYYNAQNKNVFADPKQYFLELRQRAFNLGAELKY